MSEISFARKIKEELASITYSKEEEKYILSGFIRNGGMFSFGKRSYLDLRTEDALIAKLLFVCLKDCYELSPELKYENVRRFGKDILVYQVYAEDQKIEEMLLDLEVLQDGFIRMPIKNGLHLKNFPFLLVGCFLANGSINNPNVNNTSYFVEMAFTNKNDAMAIKHKIDTFKGDKAMNFKYILRRDKHILYLKKSDSIATFLQYIRAIDGMFEFEKARMARDSINNINRMTICDAANYRRSADSLKRDIDAIEKALKIKRLESFDEKTRYVIKARTENKNLNYRELADYLNEQYNLQITKSGVVHIMRNIRSFVEDK